MNAFLLFSWRVEAKIIVMSDMVLYVCRGNTLKNCIINRREYRDGKGGKVSMLHPNWQNDNTSGS